jgi:hypothetical protein
MLGLALIVALGEVGLGNDAPQNASVQGAPQRLTGPASWQAIERLEPTERTEVMLIWLVEERREPTQPSKGLSGAPIDTLYTQAQIVHSLASADPRVLKWLVESKEVKSAPMRDLIGFALALSGDLTAKPFLLGALATGKNPWLREKAATYLMEWPDNETITALEAAANDPFRIQYEQTIDQVGLVDRYPVRDAAKHSLSVIARGAKPNEWSLKWQEKFKASMQDYEDFVRDRAADLKRMAETVNKDKSST